MTVFFVLLFTVQMDGLPGAIRPSPWPHRLVVDDDLRSSAELAWHGSPTFRQQCRKLDDARALVIVRAARKAYRASARIGVTADGTIFARVRIRPGKNAVELIAHEIEHVLERVDGVSLLMEVSRGPRRASLSGGAFETRRAVDAGRRVAHEVQANAPRHRLDEKRTP